MVEEVFVGGIGGVVASVYVFTMSVYGYSSDEAETCCCYLAHIVRSCYPNSLLYAKSRSHDESHGLGRNYLSAVWC